MSIAKCPRCGEVLRVNETGPVGCPVCGSQITVSRPTIALPAAMPAELPQAKSVAVAPVVRAEPKSGLKAGVYCHGCGEWIHRDAENCPKCGVAQFEKPRAQRVVHENTSSDILTVLVLIGFVVCSLGVMAVSIVYGGRQPNVAAALFIGSALGLFIFGLMASVYGFGHADGPGIMCGILGLLSLGIGTFAGLMTLVAMSSRSW